MVLLRRWIALSACLLGLCVAARGVAAEFALTATRVIDRVPRTSQEVAAELAKSDLACLQLPAGMPLAVTSFDQRTDCEAPAPRVKADGGERLACEEGRWPAIAFATLMTDADRRRLPLLTSGAILDVVNNTYISLQAGVRRTSPDGEPFLNSLPVAAVGAYGEPAETVKFAAMQQVAMRSVRGLGLFLKPNQARNEKSLRTLVVAMQGSLLVPDEKKKNLVVEPTWELFFVRLRTEAVAQGDSAASGVRLHAFGTREGLTRLTYFKPFFVPDRTDDCAIRSTIRITEFSLAGQLPAGRAAHKVEYAAEQEFSLAELDNYARRGGMTGDALANLTEVLDAVIDGKLAE